MQSMLSNEIIDLMAKICVVATQKGKRPQDLPELWKMSEQQLNEYLTGLERESG